MKPITVLIVDDSALIRTMFRELLSEAGDIQVLDTAVDAVDAREKIKRLNPDVVTLDIEMPGMDGLSFLEKIMALRPMPVIMASTLTQKGAGETIRALEIGAVDYISKPTGSQTRNVLAELKDELIAKVRMAAAANLKSHGQAAKKEKKILAFNPTSEHLPILAFGSSTGGVEALREVFSVLPANCPPIVMTQHMPEQFTASFAARLDGLSEVTVAEATNGALLKAGHAYLAPGNRHLTIAQSRAGLICELHDGPKISGHRPSVDVLFESVAEIAGAQAIGTIFTGMGKDGAKGLLNMKQRGAYTIGQNEHSCVVYGMPKAAKMLGAVCEELPLHEIPVRLLKLCEQERNRHVS